MKRALLMVLRLALFTLPLPLAVNVSAQQIPMPGEATCNVRGTVNVTVTDLSGAVIPNAFVLFRADQGGISKDKPFLLELRTNSDGKAKASVPCGVVDFFVGAHEFTPHAARLVIAQDSSSASVRLDVYTTTEE
jgi:hypothetical protein